MRYPAPCFERWLTRYSFDLNFTYCLYWSMCCSLSLSVSVLDIHIGCLVFTYEFSIIVAHDYDRESWIISSVVVSSRIRLHYSWFFYISNKGLGMFTMWEQGWTTPYVILLLYLSQVNYSKFWARDTKIKPCFAQWYSSRKQHFSLNQFRYDRVLRCMIHNSNHIRIRSTVCIGHQSLCSLLDKWVTNPR